MSIGRNDPCPCDSGKKYKKCCLNKTQLIQIPWPISSLPENLILINLLNSSQEFSSFYTTERNKITRPLFWSEDKSLQGINAAASRLPTGEQIIRLPKIPPITDDAVVVAHELQHLVLDTYGYPIIGSNPKYAVISDSLNSLLQDVLVDKKLKEYGFDMRNKYQKESENNFRQLQFANKPSNQFNKIFWIFNYTSVLLDSEWLKQEGILTENNFSTWFDKKYPDIAEEAHALHQLINEISFATPEKMTTVYNAILNKYNLSDSLQIHTLS